MNILTNPPKYAAPGARPPLGGLRPPPRFSGARPPAPDDVVERFLARDGTPLVLRPIRPSDIEALQRGFASLTANEVRLRFLHPLNELPAAFAHSLCDLDRGTAFAWVLADPDGNSGSPNLHAVGRAFVDPVLAQAEYAIIVGHDLTGQGYGRMLMQRIIDSARALGATELWGSVLADNRPMLGLCQSLGFSVRLARNDPGVMHVSLPL